MDWPTRVRIINRNSQLLLSAAEVHHAYSLINFPAEQVQLTLLCSRINEYYTYLI